MRWIYKLPLRLRSLFRKNHVEQELDEEMRFHLEKLIEENVAKGMSPEEGRYAALREFGGIEQMKEECRDSWGVRMISELGQDIRYGLRQLRRNPGFTVVAILTLALGIGANVAVFGLLDAVLLRPLPYSHPDRLFRVFPTEARSSRAMVSTSYPDFEEWRHQSHTFEAMAAYHGQDFNLTGTTIPERLTGLSSTPGLLSLLGIHPSLGREFNPIDGQHVALLGYGLWQQRFMGNPRVIGKPIYLSGQPYTVLGVLPAHFTFPPSLWGPLQILVPVVPNPQRGWNYLRVVGRLAPSVTERQARTEMNGIAARLAMNFPIADRGQGVAIASLHEASVSGVRETTWVLFGAVLFLLVIACANVANLLLAQGTVREREITIRNMVGATRFRIMRQLLTEGLLLAAFGGAGGIGFASWLFPLMTYTVPAHTAFFTRVHDEGIHLNFPVLVFSGLLTALAIAMFGVLPAWRTARPVHTPRASLPARGMRSALITLEVALSLILLAGAGLMVRSLVRLQGVRIGFHPRGLLTMDVSLGGKKYSSPEEQAAFFEQALQRLGSLTSVASVGAVTDLPMTRSWTRNSFEILGAPARHGLAAYHEVSPGYFRTMGIPLLGGRELLESDSAHSPLVGVINQSMAREYWPNESAIGASIVVARGFATPTPKGTTVQFKRRRMEIVGVVGNVRQLGLDVPPVPELFMPFAQWPSDEMSLVVRGRGSPSALIPILKKEIWSVDSDQPVTDIATMDQWLAMDTATRRYVLRLVGAFALIAVLLAAAGVYGVVSYWMRRRTHEIGIRMALGAERSDVLKLVVGDGLMLVLLGIPVGIIGGLGVTRFLSSLLYRVKPTDPLTFIAVSFILIAVALLACYIPARRAAKVDPMVALRYE